MKNKQHTLELYLHIPFCVQKCSYCDFLSFQADAQVQEEYVRALLREIRASEEGAGREVASVFIGGGTPSVLAPHLIMELMEETERNFSLLPDAEITIEANPGTLDGQKLSAYRRAGVNRLSLGLQSTDNRELAELGRIHRYETFCENYGLAREAGFSNINVDLMSALPKQTTEGWARSLHRVAALAPEHISAYSLMIEEGTPFAGRELSLPDEDTEYRMYEETAQILGQYGYRQYEISNYAKEGFASRHNIGYWKRTDYLGLGLGAASLIGKQRFSNTRSIKAYLKDSGCPSSIRVMEPRLTAEDEMAEFMFLGLRMTEGISREEFLEAFGRPVEAVYGKVLKKYMALGLLAEKSGQIFLTRRGIHVSNSVMSEFLF